MFAGILAKLAASVVGGYVKKGCGLLSLVPRPVWEALAVLGYALALFGLHQHYAHAAIKAADTAGYQRRVTEDAKVIAQLEARVKAAEASAAAKTQEVRLAHEQETRANAAAADALRVRGPGAARCVSVIHPALPATARGPGESGRPGDAAVAGLPDEAGVDLAAVPFNDAATFAQQHDDLRSEVIAWHKWYPAMVAEWDKLRQSLAAPRK